MQQLLSNFHEKVTHSEVKDETIDLVFRCDVVLIIFRQKIEECPVCDLTYTDDIFLKKNRHCPPPQTQLTPRDVMDVEHNEVYFVFSSL